MDMTTWILIGGIFAGVLQLLGYVAYLTNEDIDPEPVTWFMFAYGTAILALLEWDADATTPELILPIVCAILAIFVSWRCWKKAKIANPLQFWPRDWWPEDYWDRFSFISDILITVAYIAAWILAGAAFLSPDNRDWAVLAFLFLSNLSTFPSFYPILRSTWNNPEREHWLPWFIWSAAYCVLALVTYSIYQTIFHPLMLYPLSNAVLHAIVGLLACNRLQPHYEKVI